MTYALCLLLDGMIDQLQQQTGRKWHEDTWTFLELTAGVKDLLEYLRPVGDAVIHEDAPLLRSLARQGHVEIAEQIRTGAKRAQVGKFAASVAAINFGTIARSSHSFPPGIKTAAELITAQVAKAENEGIPLVDLWSYSL